MKTPFINWTTVIAIACGGLPAPSAFAQFQYERLKSFGVRDSGGQTPGTRVIEGSDGKLYGTTTEGGPNFLGTIFSLSKDGGTYAVLHAFSRDDVFGGDAAWPSKGDLVEGSDGALYGTTSGGGSYNAGSVFKLNKDGSGFTILRSLGNSAEDGAQPESGVIEASDGKLYGTTPRGGLDAAGTVFTLNKDGTGYTVLLAEGAGYPRAPLLEGRDGVLYGTSYFGGVFKLNKDGTGHTVLNCGEEFPRAGLLEGSDGALYGTTPGEDVPGGTVFKLNKDGTGCTVLHAFSDGHPQTSLLEGSDGALYGTTSRSGIKGLSQTVFRLSKDGNDFKILRDFYDSTNGGANPVGLFQARDGKLYGTTQAGGSNNVGAVFELNTDGGSFALVHEFVADTSAGDPVWPDTRLQEGGDGAVYGTSRLGGPDDAGTVFKVAKDGRGYKVLLGFTWSVNLGGLPTSLLAAHDRILYGTCQYGGHGAGGNNPGGTVFKLNRDGSGFSAVRHFGVTPGDGQSPMGLVEGSDGILYGTTSSGGKYTNQSGWGPGTVFKLSKDGSNYRILHDFGSVPDDGSVPYAAPIEGSDGALYGTTLSAAAIAGTVYRLLKDGTDYSVLHRFTSKADGTGPGAALMEGSDGTLYGTTRAGGIDDRGTVFKLNKNGSGYSVLHRFGNFAGDGLNAEGALVEIGDVLYGVTANGGTNDCHCGTVFQLNRDGTGYAIVHAFSGWDGSSPVAGITQGSDGALYGAAEVGGDAGVGAVFALRPRPILLSPVLSGGGVIVRLAGLPGSSQMLQSVSVLTGRWSTLTNVVVPATGMVEFFDGRRSASSGFYRATAP